MGLAPAKRWDVASLIHLGPPLAVVLDSVVFVDSMRRTV
jgi:hypothetical protein